MLSLEDYIVSIQTEQDYEALVRSGMAWEFFPFLPNSFKEHQVFVEEYFKKREIDKSVLDLIHHDVNCGIPHRDMVKLLQGRKVKMEGV